MRVKMLKIECGPNGNHHPGDVREVDDGHGRQLIADGCALDITPKVIEAAVLVQPEKAVMPPAQKHRRGR